MRPLIQSAMDRLDRVNLTNLETDVAAVPRLRNNALLRTKRHWQQQNKNTLFDYKRDGADSELDSVSACAEANGDSTDIAFDSVCNDSETVANDTEDRSTVQSQRVGNAFRNEFVERTNFVLSTNRIDRSIVCDDSDDRSDSGVAARFGTDATNCSRTNPIDDASMCAEHWDVLIKRDVEQLGAICSDNVSLPPYEYASVPILIATRTIRCRFVHRERWNVKEHFAIK